MRGNIDERRRLFAQESVLARWRSKRAFRRVVAASNENGGRRAWRLLMLVAGTPGHVCSQAATELLTRQLDDQVTVNMLAAAWRDTRAAVLEKLIRSADLRPATTEPTDVPLLLLLGGQLPVQPPTPAHADALVTALDDADCRIRDAASVIVTASADDRILTALGARWVATRQETFEAALVANGRLPTGPADVRVLAALRLDNEAALGSLGADAMPALLAATSDADEAIASRAHAALRHLADPEAQRHLCDRALAGDPAATAAVRDAGYLPEEVHNRAACLFVTEQWDRYRALDYDGRLLGALYATARPQVRDRILTVARASGQADAVRLLLGGDRRSRIRAISSPEAEYLVRSLVGQGRHDEAWGLAFELPFVSLLSAAAHLDAARWQPSSRDDERLLSKLVAVHDLRVRVGDLMKELPVAVQLGTVPVPDPAAPGWAPRRGPSVRLVSFAPDAPHLAVATNMGQVGVWDFAQGRLRWKRAELPRSIDRMVHAGADRIVASTYRGYGTPGYVHLVGPDQVDDLGRQDRSVIGLARCADGQVVSCSDDGELVTWSLDGSAPRRFRATATDMSRGSVRWLCTAENGRAALVGYRAWIVDLDAGRVVGSGQLPSLFDTSPCSAALAPGGMDLLVGDYEGLTGVYRVQPDGLVRVRELPRHGGCVRVAAVPTRSLVLTAGYECSQGSWVQTSILRVHQWPDGEVIGELEVRYSIDWLSVSPTGEFLVLKHGIEDDFKATLWDLRPAEVHTLFLRPLVDATPAHLAILSTAKREHLSAPSRQCVDVMAALLRHKFRHAVGIEEPVRTGAQRFDIELG